jgi:hypothetical protein
MCEIAVLWRFPRSVRKRGKRLFVFLAFHQTGISTAFEHRSHGTIDPESFFHLLDDFAGSDIGAIWTRIWPEQRKLLFSE